MTTYFFFKKKMRQAGVVQAVTGVMTTHVESVELQAMGCSALSNILAPGILRPHALVA